MSLNAFRGDSYCGLYCGACEVLNLHREAQRLGKSASWDDLPPALKEVIPPSAIACTGCKTDLVSPGCRDCVIRSCARGKKAEACVLCPEFPCELVTERKRTLEKNLTETLPHIRVKFGQVERIKELGYPRWCEKQAKRWTCPRCGFAFTWYQETCAHCGLALERFKEHNTGI